MSECLKERARPCQSFRIIIGAVMAAGVTRFARAMLYGVTPTDVLTSVSVGGLLLAVTLAAGWIPVRRGLRVDPVALLRAE